MANVISPIDIRSVHRICSGQVVLDLAGAVKELVENSIDACATSIEIKFQDSGQGGLEVVDNGIGIDPFSYESLAMKHATSKLKSFEDLERVHTFGFRGEALSSLCSLSEVVVTTATRDQAPKGTRLVYDAMGRLVSKTPTARSEGTTVQISNIFNSLPVRKQEFKRNAKRDYAKALTMIQTYAIISKDVRIIAVNQPLKGQATRSISTNGNTLLRDNIANVFGTKLTSQIMPFSIDLSSVITIEEENESPRVEGFVSIPQWGYGRGSSDRQYVYINGRPCHLPKITKSFNEVYRSFISNQYPFVVANIVVPTDIYDVNVSPDKRTIFLHKEQAIANHIMEDLTKQLEPHRSTYKVNAPLPTQPADAVSQEEPPRSPLDIQRLNIRDAGVANVDDAVDDSTLPERHFPRNTQPSTAITQPKSSNYRLTTTRSSPNYTNESKKRTNTSLLDFMSKRPRPSESNANDGVVQNKTSVTDEEAVDDLMLPSDEDPESESSEVEEDAGADSGPEIPAEKGRRVIKTGDIAPSQHLWNTTNEDVFTKVDANHLLNRTPDQVESSNEDHDSIESQELADLERAGVSNTEENDIATDALNRVIKKSDFSRMQVIGQFNLGFIVVTLDDRDLYIIDQHAADEKYNFETLQKTTRIDGQRLIRPHNPCLPASEELVAMDNADILRANGFEIEIHPENEPTTRIKVISQPVSKNIMFDHKDFGELVSLLSERPREMVRCSRTRAMFASRACRMSVMIGDALTARQMTSVVRHMGDIDQPWNCPHGRPTMRHLLCLKTSTQPRTLPRNLDCLGSLFAKANQK